MKRISLSILIVSLAAFNAKSQVSFGVQAGGHLSSVEAKQNGTTFPGKKSTFGFKIGGVASVPLSGPLSFMPELNFVRKGGKFSRTETVDLGVLGKITNNIKQEYSPSFIEVPLNLAYNAGNEGGSGFFGGLGPVVSFGIGGNAKASVVVTSVINGTTTTNAENQSANIKFDGKKDATDDNLHLKGFEFGGNVFAGYKMSNGFFAKASYNMGFSNLSPEDKSSFKTSYFGISIGYFFGSK